MTDFRWLIEAPGQKYLAVRRVAPIPFFEWSSDHNKAFAFRSQQQADDMIDALRGLYRDLFAFEPLLGNAKTVEHGWMSDKEPGRE